MRKSKEELESLKETYEIDLRVAIQKLVECEAQKNYNACHRKLRECKRQLNKHNPRLLRDRLEVLEDYKFTLIRERAMIEDSWTAKRSSIILNINRLLGVTDRQIAELKQYLLECE